MTSTANKPTDLHLDKQALFRDLHYTPHPGQLAVHLSKAPRRILAAGVRFGKSTCAAGEVLAAALMPGPSTVSWVTAPTFGLTKPIMQVIEHTLRSHLSHRLAEVLPSGRGLRVINLSGAVSEIHAKSADNPVSLVGEAVDFLVLDEAARLRAEIWENHLSQRLIDTQGDALIISTPRGPGWFFELLRRGLGRDEQYESWRFPSWENPHISSSAIEEERGRLPEKTFRQEYGAEFVDVGAVQCYSCGDPRQGASGMVIVKAGEELAVCDECGQFVNEEGRSLRALLGGRPDLTIIELWERMPAVCFPTHEPVPQVVEETGERWLPL